MRVPNPLRLVQRWVDWFESRGGYVPGEDSRVIHPGREFGWLITTWLVAVALLIVLLSVAG